MYGRGPHSGSSLRRAGGYPAVIGKSHLQVQGFRSLKGRRRSPVLRWHSYLSCLSGHGAMETAPNTRAATVANGSGINSGAQDETRLRLIFDHKPTIQALIWLNFLTNIK